ncbi:hypothetical protein EX30DRAFT_325649 [Ascodesmis nigricans]|uniref:Peroxisome assembly protein 12 n=1 Tax=Ascodesmis nigricans TaxID=341454 RepID=A0A4S2N682_9PEZI|nr:hypothetical protein EX30DRAFT_325649 [Ascodesmis nigricans]
MEFMSNITNMDDATPSLFELLSESQLRDLLEPSLRYLLALLTHRYPRYLIQILNNWEECYALLMLLVERHYLTHYQGSFTENFYGLKRERALPVRLPRAQKNAEDMVAKSAKLSKRDVYKSLAVIVGVRYLKCKLDDAYENFAGGAAANVLGAGFREEEAPGEDASIKERAKYWTKIALRKTYPTVNGAYYLSTLAFNLAFLFERSYYHTPMDWLIGVRMRRLTETDHRAQNAPKPTRRGQPPTLSARTLLSPSILTRIILPKLLDSLKLLLPTSIFFLKFLEWWHASDFARQLATKTAASIELPPPKDIKPPKPEIAKEEGLELVSMPEDSSECPICEKEIVNATATQTGHVFCYPCVFRWVQDGLGKTTEEDGREEDRKGRCPITGVRLLGGTEGLRRLMI